MQLKCAILLYSYRQKQCSIYNKIKQFRIDCIVALNLFYTIFEHPYISRV